MPPKNAGGGGQGGGPFGGLNQGLVGSFLSGVWHWLNAQANNAAAGAWGSVVSFAKTVASAAFTRNSSLYELTGGMRRQAVWIVQKLTWIVQGLMRPEIAKLWAAIRSDYSRLVTLIATALTWAEHYTDLMTGRERQARRRAVAKAEVQARQEIKAMHQAIEREAVSAYRAGLQGRLGVIGHLADFIASDNPATRQLVGRLVGIILDLVAIENPVARLAAGFLIRHVIDRLGVDKVAGTLLQDLAAPILGQPRPRGLYDVIADVSQRLAAGEQQWATFMADGGSEVEQAGRQWQDITGPLGDVAILAFFGAAVADPGRWAADVTHTANVAVDAVITATRDLMKAV